ncbi:MAG TPA: DUF2784 domain-containing protein [Sphingobacteriaceae bacterium]|nr:DUF2784 domain-containing protein [Sphingobacteriaceae bacterium]
MNKLLDIVFTLLHLVIIGFNLVGWIWPSTRKLHLFVVGITIASWVVLGIWYGLGYCPLTDWHWQVKEKLGEQNLPNSFIKYFADKIIGQSIDSGLIDAVTASGFALAIGFAVYYNFIRKNPV